jgi:hypothetical protein
MATQPIDRLRAICLGLPEAVEKEAWGDPTFRVRGKIFGMEKGGDGRRRVCVGLIASRRMPLRMSPDRPPTIPAGDRASRPALTPPHGAAMPAEPGYDSRPGR